MINVLCKFQLKISSLILFPFLYTPLRIFFALPLDHNFSIEFVSVEAGEAILLILCFETFFLLASCVIFSFAEYEQTLSDMNICFSIFGYALYHLKKKTSCAIYLVFILMRSSALKGPLIFTACKN